MENRILKNSSWSKQIVADKIGDLKKYTVKFYLDMRIVNGEFYQKEFDVSIWAEKKPVLKLFKDKYINNVKYLIPRGGN